MPQLLTPSEFRIDELHIRIMDSSSEPGQLVRTYSIELENNLPPNIPANDLRRVFIENERRIGREEEESASWRKYYEPWDPLEENT